MNDFIENYNFNSQDAIIIENDYKNKEEQLFESSVWIQGDVFEGANIKVNGDILIEGVVEPVNIYCTGNVLIRGNCFGEGRGEIDARGDVVAKSFNEYSINTQSNLFFNDLIKYSIIFSKKSVKIISPEDKGVIIGGKIYARDNITAKVIGSNLVIETDLLVGYDYKKRFFYNNLKLNLRNYKLFLEKNYEYFSHFFPEFDINYPHIEIDIIMKYLDKIDDFKSQLLKLLECIKVKDEIKVCEYRISNFSFENFTNLDAYILIEKAFPGVNMTILDQKISIIEETDFYEKITRENIKKWQQ